MELVYIGKKLSFYFLLALHDKFLALPPLTPLEKNLGTTTSAGGWNYATTMRTDFITKKKN